MSLLMNVMNRSLVSIMMNVVLGLFCKDLCSLTWRLKICTSDVYNVFLNES